jgi:hypothetical protein
MTGSYLDAFPGFRHWAATSDSWVSRNGDQWFADINCRTVKVAVTGVISIGPDEDGSTAWFADVLRGGGRPAPVGAAA